MQASTVASDAVLALVSAVAAVWLWRSRAPEARLGAVGLAPVAAAAAVGSVRFAGLEGVAGLHVLLSRTAACVGVPLLGLAWAWTAVPRVGRGVGAVSVALCVAGVAAEVGGLALWRLAVGALAMVAVGVASGVLARSGRIAAAGAGAAGASLTLAMGLAVGTEGALAGIPRVDIFHLGLALANATLAWGLMRARV